MLLADLAPEDIVVGKAAPMFGDLGGTTEGYSVEVGKDLERDFAREDNERVDSDEVTELLCEKGELGEAAHGEQALEDELPSGVRGRGKVGPDRVDDLSFLFGKGIKGLWVHISDCWMR